MAARGTYHEGRVLELVKKFKIWKDQRLAGARAFQSTYDRYVISLVGMKELPICLHSSQSGNISVQVAIPGPSRHECKLSI